jgi:hypothetical protein
MTGIGVCTDRARAAAEYANASKNFFGYAAKRITTRFGYQPSPLRICEVGLGTVRPTTKGLSKTG